jgi:hypothetical protein
VAYISILNTVAYLTREKLKVLSGLLPHIPASVPESALEESVNQIRASSGNTGPLFFFSVFLICFDHDVFSIMINWYDIVRPHFK